MGYLNELSFKQIQRTCFFIKHLIEKTAKVHNVIVIALVAEPYDKHNVSYDC